MSKEKDRILAENVLDLLGGVDNVIAVTHCATRLRPQLKNRDLCDVKEIEELAGVNGVVNKDSGVQIIIGLNVGSVYDEFIKIANIDSEESENSSGTVGLVNSFVQMAVGIFGPLLPILAGSGLLRGLTILANELGWLAVESTTNQILTFAGTSVFAYLSVMVAYSAAKYFDADPFISVAITGSLIVPGFAELIEGNGGNLINFFGVPMPVFNYGGQVIPAIILAWVQSKFEGWLKDKIPTSLHLIVVPTVLLLTMIPLYGIIIGPFANYISLALASAVTWVENTSPVLTGIVCGPLWIIMIMFGVHWAPNTMVVIPELAAKGYSPLIAYAATANFGMAGAAFAVYLKTKDKKLKNFSLGAIVSVMLSGIVEPAIYGIGVKYKTPLLSGCIGSATGAAFMGIFNVVGYAFVFGGLTTIPAFAGPTLWAYCVGLAIAFVVGCIATLLIGFEEIEE